MLDCRISTLFLLVYGIIVPSEPRSATAVFMDIHENLPCDPAALCDPAAFNKRGYFYVIN